MRVREISIYLWKTESGGRGGRELERRRKL